MHSWCAQLVCSSSVHWISMIQKLRLVTADVNWSCTYPRASQEHSIMKDSCITRSSSSGFAEPLNLFLELDVVFDMTPALIVLWALSWVNGSKILLKFGCSWSSRQNLGACHVHVISTIKVTLWPSFWSQEAHLNLDRGKLGWQHGGERAALAIDNHL